MGTELQTAGLFASIAFLVVGIGGYIGTQNTLQSLIYGLVSSLVLGFIGFQIAHIWAHPQGRRKRGRKAAVKSSAVMPQKGGAPSAPITGDEIFLDDLGS